MENAATATATVSKLGTPTSDCLRRLRIEWKELSTSPPENIIACPNPNNVLEWHFVILGPVDTPYEGGVYHGMLVLKPDYPHSPPSIYMFTPSGRFEPNVRICLSMSDYHPETWNPAWSISTILVGLLSFMLESEITAGSITTSEAQKRELATHSMDFNAKNPVFCERFPELLADDEAAVAADADGTAGADVLADSASAAAAGEAGASGS